MMVRNRYEGIMAQKVSLAYTTVKGKHFEVVLESKAKALETLKKLKQFGIVETYAKGRKTRSRIYGVTYCPICNKIMDTTRKNEVHILNPTSMKQIKAHRSCCEKAKIPYRLYDDKNIGNENMIIYPE
jgi:type III secretion system FlhB-like substrate exporter